jgi:hypothetical protein
VNHVFVRHTKCASAYCNICDGGLAVCSVCGSAEGSLTTDCPGGPVDYQRERQVYRGELDFVNGAWVVGRSRHAAPAGQEPAGG